LVAGYGGDTEPINLIKIEEKEENSFLKFTPNILPHDPNTLLFENNNNDEIGKEIMDFICPNNLPQDNEKHQKTLEKLNLEFANDSLDSYHEEHFEEDYNNMPNDKIHNHDHFKRPRIPSRLSGYH